MTVAAAQGSMSPAAVGALTIGGVVACGAVIELAGQDDGPSICPVRRWTGGWCPGCGAARAARHLLHGDIAAAWGDHPWLVLSVVQVIVLGPTLWVVRTRWRDRWLDLLAIVAASNVVVLLGSWALRLAFGEIPAPI